MDPAEAIADLKQVSPQIRTVTIATREGASAASSEPPTRANELARVGSELFADAVAAAGERGRSELAQLEIATPDGSVFVVAGGDRLIVATTVTDPTVGLVFYDLKTCLRTVSEPAVAPAEGS